MREIRVIGLRILGNDDEGKIDFKLKVDINEVMLKTDIDKYRKTMKKMVQDEYGGNYCVDLIKQDMKKSTNK